MRNSKQLREEITALADRSTAIVALAEEEKRELTAEEKAEIDSIHGAGDKAGKIAALEQDLDRVSKIEARQKQIAADRAKQVIEPQQAIVNGQPKIVVPAQARRHGKLKAFTDPADAYASGQWLRAISHKDETIRAQSREWCSNHGLEIKAVMTEGVNTAGGFLVPSPMEGGIIRLVEDYGIVRQEFLNYPMSSESDSFPKRTGGLTVYFPGEAGSITASDASLGRESLLARKMATLTRVSSELSEDAIISIVDLLSQEIALAFATTEDEQGFNGTGASATYGGAVGLITAILDGSTVTAATGNTTFDTLDDADFLSMIGRLRRYPGIMPKWYIHKAGWAASMARLAAAAGGNTAREFEGGLQPMFHGYPVVWVNVMNSTLTAQTSTDGLCYFGDLRMGATLGIRRGISIAADSSVYFATDEVAIRATQRTAINVHSTGSATAGDAGAIVMLATPSS